MRAEVGELFLALLSPVLLQEAVQQGWGNPNSGMFTSCWI